MLKIIPPFVVLCHMFDKMPMRRVNKKKDGMSGEEFLLFYFGFLLLFINNVFMTTIFFFLNAKPSYFHS